MIIRTKFMFLLHFSISITTFILFVLIAETVYWDSKNQYNKAKAKYLRDIIVKKNDMDSPDKAFYSCVYKKWGSKEMKLSKAIHACEIDSSHLS